MKTSQNFGLSSDNSTHRSIPLKQLWTFYFDEKIRILLKLSGSTRGAVVGEGEKETPKSPSSSTNQQMIGTFQTVQEFWNYWNNIQITKLPENSNLKIIKGQGSPTLEENNSGGKWIVAFDKDEKIAQKWLMCVLALIGEQFNTTDLCGSVLSIGRRSNTISLWTKSTDKKVLAQTEADLSQFLDIQREKIRFQRQNASEAKGKTFSIKLSRSVDLNSPLSLPNIETSPTSHRLSETIKTDHSDEENFIDLTRDPENESPVSSPTRLSRHSELKGQKVVHTTPAYVKPIYKASSTGTIGAPAGSTGSGSASLSSSASSMQSPMNSPRSPTFLSPYLLYNSEKRVPHMKKFSTSIDASSFLKWKDSETQSNDDALKSRYSLPKFYRRRGRRTSKSPSSSPLKTTPSDEEETVIEETTIQISKEEESEESQNSTNEDQFEESTLITPINVKVQSTSPTIPSTQNPKTEVSPLPTIIVSSSESNIISISSKKIKTKTRTMPIPISPSTVPTTVSEPFTLLWRLLLGASAILMIIVAFGVIPALTETRGF